jgi:hypothetical protein
MTARQSFLLFAVAMSLSVLAARWLLGLAGLLVPGWAFVGALMFVNFAALFLAGACHNGGAR